VAALETTGRFLRSRSGGYVRAFTLSLFGVLFAQACAAAGEPFVMGTDSEEGTLMGKVYRRVYSEAFRRMDVPLTVVIFPTARLTMVADQGDVHGQPSRVYAYADAHPNQLRVDEVLHDARLALYAFGPGPQPGRTEDLAAGKWRVEYRRGVAVCEKLLKPLVATELLSDVTNAEQGLKKLKAGRTDLYCDIDLAVRSELLTSDFKGIVGYRKALDLGTGLPLYPYVHKSRAELVPKLARTLKAMKAEGFIERSFSEVERELEATR
jgi:hypothetical protein